MASNNLYDAHQQWSKRPDDERFASLREMHDTCKRYRDSARTSAVLLGDLRVEPTAEDGNLALVGRTGVNAKLSNYCFGQVARWAKAPADYMRRLPPTLAAQNINHGLKRLSDERGQSDKLNVLFHQNGNLVARAVTSDSYDRVWNYDVVQRIMETMPGNGWVVPPARPARDGQAGTRTATAADILPNQGDFGLAVKEGDLIAPAGLYASDHDMFAFLVNMNTGIWDGTKFLNRGVFIQNSEVGDCALRFKFFTLDNVCGNHIVWGAGKVTEVAIRHVKSERLQSGRTMRNAFHKWQIASGQLPSADEVSRGIMAAKAKEIAATKEDVLDAVFKFAKVKGLNRLTRDTLDGGYDVAERTPRYGAPTTVWGLVNGLTEYSQTGASHTDDRTELDTQAGRLMEMAF